MSLTINKTAQTVEFRDTGGQLCGIYHYTDPYKSFFRGLYTPSGRDIVASPPPDHPHHKGLQFGLTTDQANFWEEPGAQVPPNNKLPFGQQQTTKLDLMSPGDGIGFTQEVLWGVNNEPIFNETRNISLKKDESPAAYVWTWHTVLTAACEDVHITKSVWGVPGYCSPSDYGYCGFGLRLAQDLFQYADVLPSDPGCGSTPPYVCFKGKEAQICFEQHAKPANALFVSTYQDVEPYAGGPGFAFLCLVPIPQDLKQGMSLEATYVIAVADV